MTAPTTVLHATSVAIGANGLLIVGASGSGKSTLALQLMAMGAELVADDRTIVAQTPRGLWASCPPPLGGQIESRGIGLIDVPFCAGVIVNSVVDLDKVENSRMPSPQTIEILGQKLTLFRKCDGPGFAASLLLLLRHGPRK